MNKKRRNNLQTKTNIKIYDKLMKDKNFSKKNSKKTMNYKKNVKKFNNTKHEFNN